MQSLLGDVEHFRIVNAAVVKHLLDNQPKGEWGNVQHVQQGRFAGSHFISSLDQLHITLRVKKGKVSNKMLQGNPGTETQQDSTSHY